MGLEQGEKHLDEQTGYRQAVIALSKLKTDKGTNRQHDGRHQNSGHTQ
jgi:hypothetical protein